MNPFLLLFPLLLPAAQSACINCGGANKTSAKRLKMPNKSVFTRLAGIELMEIFEISNQINHEVCAQQCDAHAECAVFEFNLPNKLCVLASEYARLSDDLTKGAFETIVFVKVRGKFTKAIPKDKETCLDKSEYEDYVKTEVDKWLNPTPKKPTSAAGSSSDSPTTTVPHTIQASDPTPAVSTPDTTTTKDNGGGGATMGSSDATTASEGTTVGEGGTSGSTTTTTTTSMATSSAATSPPAAVSTTSTTSEPAADTTLAPSTSEPASSTIAGSTSTATAAELSTKIADAVSSPTIPTSVFKEEVTRESYGSTSSTMDQDHSNVSTGEKSTHKEETLPTSQDTRDPSSSESTIGPEDSSSTKDLSTLFSSSAPETTTSKSIAKTTQNKIACKIHVSGFQYELGNGEMKTEFQSGDGSGKYRLNKYTVMQNCVINASSNDGKFFSYGPFDDKTTQLADIDDLKDVVCVCAGH